MSNLFWSLLYRHGGVAIYSQDRKVILAYLLLWYSLLNKRWIIGFVPYSKTDDLRKK
jgi:hypothetical protein